ncbi:MAG: hypothetical protein C0506_09220 [Anaerolinea sp.]|nr:hypothetical protein [Anaerolinea sp.]
MLPFDCAALFTGRILSEGSRESTAVGWLICCIPSDRTSVPLPGILDRRLIITASAPKSQSAILGRAVPKSRSIHTTSSLRAYAARSSGLLSGCNGAVEGQAVRIEALSSFVTLVRTGSYSGAGDEMFMSSTTIHGQIRSLEEELGTPLVTFSGRKLHLTAAGSRLLLFAERTLEERANLGADISGVSRRSPARLRIASLHGPSIHLLPPVIRAYRDLQNDVIVSVATSDVGGGIASLVSGQADLVILNDLHSDEVASGFAVTTVYEDQLAMIIRADYYCPPDVALVEKYPVAAQAATSAYRRYIEQWSRTVGVSMHVAFEHSSFDGLLSYVMQGECVGMVSGYLAKMSPLASQLKVLNLPNFQLKRKVIAAHPIRPTPMTADFLQFLHDFYFGSGEASHSVDTRIS